MKFKLLVLMFFCSLFAMRGQSLQGPSGLLNAPSADMLDDGTFFVGVHHMDKVNFKNFGASTPTSGWQEADFKTVFLDVTLFSFMEINLRNNLKDMIWAVDRKVHTQVDRNLSVKLQPLKESKILPAVAVGVVDVYGNGYEEMYYGVATKHFNMNNEQLGVTVGWAHSPQRYYNRNMNGVFAGVDYHPSFLPQLDLMAEYDSQVVNIGASLLLFHHLYFIAGLQDCRNLSGGVSYRIYLKK